MFMRNFLFGENRIKKSPADKANHFPKDENCFKMIC